MGNRQDRRYAAKMARQAGRKGASMAEATIYEGAADYLASKGQRAGQIGGLSFTLEGFDEAWGKVSPDLRDILAEHFEDFRQEVFARAGWGEVGVDGGNGIEIDADLEIVLLPVIGRRSAIAAYVGNPANLEALGQSLRESGVFEEDAAYAALPVILAPAAVDLVSVGPAAVAELNSGLSEAIDAYADGVASGRDAVARISEALALPTVPLAADDGEVSGFILGTRIGPARNDDLSDEEEEESERLGRAAVEASWFDSYAADLPFLLGTPVLWHEAAVTLAWLVLQGEIAVAAAGRGLDGRVTELHACLFTDEGDVPIVALVGTEPLGPFAAARDLVAADPDGFVALVEEAADAFVAHGRPEGVLRLLTAPGNAARTSGRR